MTSSVERPDSGGHDSHSLYHLAHRMFRSSSLVSIPATSHLVPSFSHDCVVDVADIFSVSTKKQKPGCRTRFESQPASTPRNNSISNLSHLVPMKQTKQRCQSPLLRNQSPLIKLPANLRRFLPQTCDNKFDSHARNGLSDTTQCKSVLSVSVSVVNPAINRTCQMAAVSDNDCVLQRVSHTIRQLLNGDDFGHVVSTDILSELLQINRASIILLDCRSFVTFHAGHITDALNVSCADSISRKRLTCGRATVWDMVCGGDEAKNKFKQATDDDCIRIVLYDDNSTEFNSLPACHPLRIVFNCLRNSGQKPLYLSGGFQTFYKGHAHLCSLPAEQSVRTYPCCPTGSTMISSENPIDSALISEILPELFIGNERDAGDRSLLARLGITHVINVTSHVPLYFESNGVKYLRIPAADSGNQNLKQYFNDAFQFIDVAINNRGKVLVHCQAGVSRSSTIVIAYVMTRSKLRMLEGLRFVKERRAIVAPNFNFLGQLLELEVSIYNGEAPRRELSTHSYSGGPIECTH